VFVEIIVKCAMQRNRRELGGIRVSTRRQASPGWSWVDSMKLRRRCLEVALRESRCGRRKATEHDQNFRNQGKTSMRRFGEQS